MPPFPLGFGATPAFGGAGADQIALQVGKPAEYLQHQAPGAGAGVAAHGSASDRNSPSRPRCA
jgi:hypothetical protein